MRITFISDTHGLQDELGTLSGDVLVHCGDMFDLRDEGSAHLRVMDEWFGKQDFELVLCTGGNHDFVLEHALRDNSSPFQNAVCLQDQRYTHRDVVFYGAPWVPMLKNHAFFGSKTALPDKWSLIPADTDVLITHTPPYAVLDRTSRGSQVGCEHLENALKTVRPKVHAFGHVHASAGMLDNGDTLFR